MMKIAALCDQETAVGLRLAGIHELFIPKQVTMIALFQDLTKRTDIGIVLITEPIARDLGLELKEFRIHKKHPIFVEIPDKKGKLEDHVDIVSHLIKRAVGLDVNKKEIQR
jgi:V/A-type H+-transporting ATPase subunit F